ncbi:MAG: hypothetical protein HZB65_02085 [Candidatus Aenigmarchaeota archaeon]|nr:hypothetical protein [Candidatus Aenigmarchaeota archaeon]
MNMTLTESKVLTLPEYEYRGFSVPEIELSRELHGYLNITRPAYGCLNITRQARELAPLSSPASIKVFLYHVGRDLSYRFEGVEKLPEIIKQAGVLVYNDCQAKIGIWDWHKDAVIILDSKETIPGNLRPGKDYVVALYYQDIQGVVEKNNDSEIIPSTDTKKQEPVKIWVQPGRERIIVPTKDGLYSPLGPPIETLPRGQDAKAKTRYEDAGLDYEKERSLSYVSESGIRVPFSGSDEHGGALSFGLVSKFWEGYYTFGSFLASRSPSGARRDSEKTYQDGLRDGTNQTLDELQSTMQKLRT